MKRHHRPLRAVLSQLPFQHRIHDLWWSWKAKKKEILTSWNRETGVVFIHTPKCAGTSVYKTLKMQQPEIGSHIPIKAYYAADAELAPRLNSFTFVRNPWDRFVSAFHYLAFHAEGSGDRSFAAANFGDEPNFAEFTNRFLSDRKYRCAVLSHPHFRPQVHYVFTADWKHKPKYVFRIEDGLEQLSEITEGLGMELTVESTNFSQRAGYRDYFTEDQADGIGKVYRKDVDMLGYAF